MNEEPSHACEEMHNIALKQNLKGLEHIFLGWKVPI